MQRIWAIADLHLSFSSPEKDMAVFGPAWHDYQERISFFWRSCVGEKDWVLLPGDISWAMKFERALIDLQWIEQLPGKKLLSRGNHDYWWPSKKKWKAADFQTIFLSEGELFELDETTAVVGSSLAESSEYTFETIVDWSPSRPRNTATVDVDRFQKELQKLHHCLHLFKEKHLRRLVMVHYPPIGLFGKPSDASRLLESFQVDICLFGHLHSLKAESASFGLFRGVEYCFCAADYLAFQPRYLIPLNEKENER